MYAQPNVHVYLHPHMHHAAYRHTHTKNNYHIWTLQLQWFVLNKIQHAPTLNMIITCMLFTIRTIFKLLASYSSISAIPGVITDSAPSIVMTQLHSPLSWGWPRTTESQITICATSCMIEYTINAQECRTLTATCMHDSCTCRSIAWLTVPCV